MKTSKKPAFLYSSSEVSPNAAMKRNLHKNKSENVAAKVTRMNGVGGISPFRYPRSARPAEMLTIHAGRRPAAISPCEAVAFCVYAPRNGLNATHPIINGRAAYITAPTSSPSPWLDRPIVTKTRSDPISPIARTGRVNMSVKVLELILFSSTLLCPDHWVSRIGFSKSSFSSCLIYKVVFTSIQNQFKQPKEKMTLLLLPRLY